MTPTRRSRTLARAIDAAGRLSLNELRELDAALRGLIADAEAAEKETRGGASRIVVEERRTPSTTYRLELVKCGKARCGRCARAPVHGPYWYAYWKQDRRTRSKYIGKKLKRRKAAA